MARTRVGGASGWVIATILLGFAFIISLILTIIFATQIGGARQNQELAQLTLSRIVTPRERNGEEFKLLTARAREQERQTVFGLLNEESKTLKNYVAGTDVEVPSIKLQSTALEVDLDGGATLLGEIERLRQNLDDTRQTLAQTEQIRAEAVASISAMESQKASAADSFNRSVADIRGQYSTLKGDFDHFQRDKNALIEQLQKNMETVRNSMSEKLHQAKSEIAQKDEVIRRLANRIDEVEAAQSESRGGGADIVPADGRIVTINRDGDLAYINLAAGDHVLPGMTFEVFDQNEVIKVDRIDEQQRGKATIEVVRVLDSSSVARIVRAEPYAIVSVGDHIVNLAYDRSAVYQFFVHGVFDINKVGRATMSDNRRVQAMIDRWGGRVTDDLNYQTDYLVLGLMPKRLQPPPQDALIFEIEDYTEKLRIYDEYRALEAEAQKLKIPVLNQNRFLGLVGHYRR